MRGLLSTEKKGDVCVLLKPNKETVAEESKFCGLLKLVCSGHSLFSVP